MIVVVVVAFNHKLDSTCQTQLDKIQPEHYIVYSNLMNEFVPFQGWIKRYHDFTRYVVCYWLFTKVLYCVGFPTGLIFVLAFCYDDVQSSVRLEFHDHENARYMYPWAHG